MGLVSGFGRGYWGEEGFGSVIPVKPTQAVNAWNEGAWGDVGFGGISRQPAAAVGQVGQTRVVEDALVTLTGFQITSGLGSVTLITQQIIPQTGLVTTASVGSVSIVGEGLLSLTGLSSTASVGSVSVVEGSGVTVPFGGSSKVQALLLFSVVGAEVLGAKVLGA